MEKESKNSFDENNIFGNNDFNINFGVNIENASINEKNKNLQNPSSLNYNPIMNNLMLNNNFPFQLNLMNNKNNLQTQNTNSFFNISSEQSTFHNSNFNNLSYLNQLQQNQINFQKQLIEKNKKLIQKNIELEKKLRKKKYQTEIIDLNVNIYKILSKEDTRTTMMIKNIPNKFTTEMIKSILSYNFNYTYDILIIPSDANKIKNFGYGFINFINSYYIPSFYYMFNGKNWSGTNSQKICEITYSKIQGKNQLIKHYPNKIIYFHKEGENFLKNTTQKFFLIPNIYKNYYISLYPNSQILNQNNDCFGIFMN